MRLRVIGPVVLLAGLLPSYAVEAQSLLWSTVTGTVADAAGQPVRQALVTLTPLGASGGTEVTTDGSGRFSFPLVSPGEYSVRAEALGYRPVVARGLSVAAAAEARVDMVMDLAAPPVLGVDTVDAGSVASAQGGTQISLSDIDALPTRFEDLSSLLQLVPRATRSHGLAGLPGSMPLLVADGVPVYGARHPVADGSHVPAAAFPVSVVSTLRVFEAAPDVELSGTAAGHALLGTRTGTTMDGLEFEGAWSGDPLWSSSELDLSAPPMTSVRAAGRGTIEVSPGRSALAVMADVLRQENPLAPRLTETEAEALVGLDPGLVADLVQPSVETFSRYSALARFDGEASETSRFFVRGAAGYLVRQFDGPGPVTLTRSAPLPEETLDYSVAAGYAAQSRPGLLVEVRGGISGSDRTFEAAADGAAAAYLAATGSVLGVLPRGAGESGRTDVVLNPATHIALGSGTLKLGGSVRASRHTMSHDFEGELLFADAASLLAQEGVARARDGSEASFSTRELGLFAQYRFAPSPRVGVTLGARYDRESVSGVEGTLDDDWLAVSGLRNDEYPTAMDQVGALASFTWDPRGDGSTRLELGSSVHHGDVD
ncbi:MAG TPA: carboxypeptidase-like regulatory domain-containing protein, partial [Longimicrobiales bacterium]|nr:carboxypeptidase-like regulatory domain-containing protein [Longimicrobiales bacterium]